MIKTQALKGIPNPLLSLFRPILFLAIGIHALLLFTPIPSEPKPKEPDDKKDPIKITQIPTAKPAVPKAVPVVKIAKNKTTVTSLVKSTPTTASQIRSSPLTSPFSTPTSTNFSSSDSLASSSTATDSTSQSKPLPPDTSESGSQGTIAKKPKPAIADPIETLYGILTSLPNAETNKTASDNLSNQAVPFDEINQPELLFKPVGNADSKPEKVLPEGLPGLERSPLLVTFPVEDNLNLTSFYQKYLEAKIKDLFEVEEVGDYGDGPLYKLTNADSILFLSLMPPKKAVGTVLSVWSKDPRENLKTR